MSAGRAFFDTSVLLYMYSSADPRKQARARDLYREYALDNRALLSTQVVQEFYTAALRKLELPREQVREVVAAFLVLPVIILDPSRIRAAMDIEVQYTISFRDALIVAAAEGGRADVLYTEDLTDGQQYGPVLARNPFHTPTAG
jgi:predicted nucleic acid-binding protein